MRHLSKPAYVGTGVVVPIMNLNLTRRLIDKLIRFTDWAGFVFPDGFGDLPAPLRLSHAF